MIRSLAGPRHRYTSSPPPAFLPWASVQPASCLMKILRLLLAWFSLGALSRADVTLAPLFQDHAVLQRDKPLPVWGRAAPGEHVSVAFHDQRVGTTAGADGRWIVYLGAAAASAEPQKSSLAWAATRTARLRMPVAGRHHF